MPISIPSGRTLPLQSKAGGGFRSLGVSGAIPAGLIFADNFDAQPDWTADDGFTDNNNIDNFNTLQNWYFGISRPFWSPKTGYPTKHPVAEVLASNVAKTKDGTGKSIVFWRESVQGGQFNSDSMQAYYFAEGVDELYVEFDITLSNELIQAYYDGDLGQTKIFRAYYFNGDETALSNFFGVTNKPGFNWDLSGKTNGYGTRNFLSYFPRGEGGSISVTEGGTNLNGTVQGLPASIVNGDLSAWYSPTATDGAGVGGTNPALIDYKNGGTIDAGPVAPDQIFGTESQWVKLGFYLKMNSAPGVTDGSMMMWLNDQRIVHAYDLAWIATGYAMKKWNTVGIGGNAQFNIYPTADQREDWYAVDNLAIYNGIPDGRGLV
jgi:hypothetical protein